MNRRIEFSPGFLNKFALLGRADKATDGQSCFGKKASYIIKSQVSVLYRANTKGSKIWKSLKAIPLIKDTGSSAVAIMVLFSRNFFSHLFIKHKTYLGVFHNSYCYYLKGTNIENKSFKENVLNNNLNNTPLNSKSMPYIDDDQTEELLTSNLPTEDKNRKKLFIILGIIARDCILAALVFIIFAQMQTSEINKVLGLGEKYLEEGKYEEAILAFDDVIAIDAKQVAAFEGKAEVYIATQKYGEAERILNKARQIDTSSKMNLLLVKVYDKTEKSDEAEKILEETITILEVEIEKTSDKTALINLYDQLISAYQRIGKDSGLIRSLCTQAYETTKDNKYEKLMKKSLIGNTSGNSINDGLVAQQGDWICYSTSYNNSTIYKIRTDGSDRQKVE